MPDAATVTTVSAALYAALTQQPAGRGVGRDVQAAGFAANGIDPPELDMDALRAGLVGLAQTLAHPSGSLLVLPEHRAMWAWCGQLVLFTGPLLFTEEEWHLQRLSAAAIRAHIANPTAENLVPRGDANTIWLATDTATVASYLPYSLLEGVIKKVCREHVSFDGRVLAQFDVLRSNGTIRRYNVGDRCSNIGHMLQLLIDSTLDADLRIDLTSVLEFISPGAPVATSCDVVFAWRNGSLHGENHAPAGSAVVLQLALLILLCVIRPDFADRREQALAAMRQAIEDQRGSPHCFYPCG